jgi:hypothetical protein
VSLCFTYTGVPHRSDWPVPIPCRVSPPTNIIGKTCHVAAETREAGVEIELLAVVLPLSGQEALFVACRFAARCARRPISGAPASPLCSTEPPP